MGVMTIRERYIAKKGALGYSNIDIGKGPYGESISLIKKDSELYILLDDKLFNVSDDYRGVVTPDILAESTVEVESESTIKIRIPYNKIGVVPLCCNYIYLVREQRLIRFEEYTESNELYLIKSGMISLLIDTNVHEYFIIHNNLHGITAYTQMASPFSIEGIWKYKNKLLTELITQREEAVSRGRDPKEVNTGTIIVNGNFEFHFDACDKMYMDKNEVWFCPKII